MDSILGQYYTSTAPTLGAVLMISTGIAPHLQLARYNAVRKIRHKSNFSAWDGEFYSTQIIPYWMESNRHWHDGDF